MISIGIVGRASRRSNFFIRRKNRTSRNVFQGIKVPKSLNVGNLGSVDEVQPPSQQYLLSLEKLNFMIGKSAYLFLYFVLALLVLWVLSQDAVNSRELFVYPLFVVLLIATLDEFFQLYTGRSGRVEDVLIDFGGGIVGVLVVGGCSGDEGG